MVEGPEYESAAMLGSNIGINDIEIMLKCSSLLNDYGLDLMEMGIALAYVFECFERGILRLEDTGGLALKWGDGDIVLKLPTEEE